MAVANLSGQRNTYAYRKVIDAWLKSVGSPAIVDCKYFFKTARYYTLGRQLPVQRNAAVARLPPF